MRISSSSLLPKCPDRESYLQPRGAALVGGGGSQMPPMVFRSLRPAADHRSPALVPPSSSLCLSPVRASRAACRGRGPSALTLASFSSALPALPQAWPVSRSGCECSQWEVWTHAFFLELGTWAGPSPSMPWGSPHCPVQRWPLVCKCDQQAELVCHSRPSPPTLHPRAQVARPRPRCLLHVPPSLLAPGVAGLGRLSDSASWHRGVH